MTFHLPTNSEGLTDKLSGVFAPVCTPFFEDEELDLAAFEANVAFYASSDILGLLVLGSNGENRSLTESERLDVLGTAVTASGPMQTVMTGAAYEAQRDTERFVEEAAALGVDFALILPPSYFKKAMTPTVLYRYFTSLADESPIPILLYNAPEVSGIALSLDLVRDVSAHPNIVGMKDSAKSGIERFLELERDDFHVMAGSVSFLFTAMLAGSIGGTVSLANVFPDIVQRLFSYGANKNVTDGAPLNERCKRLNSAISGAYGVAGVKAAMDIAGLTGGIPRRPLLPLSGDEKSSLAAVLESEGVLGG